MVHGAWGMVHGAWGMVHGAWGMVHGAWGMVHGAWDGVKRWSKTKKPRNKNCETLKKTTASFKEWFKKGVLWGVFHEGSFMGGVLWGGGWFRDLSLVGTERTFEIHGGFQKTDVPLLQRVRFSMPKSLKSTRIYKSLEPEIAVCRWCEMRRLCD